MIYLVADGSCSASDLLGGWGALVISKKERTLLYGGSFGTTISRCELFPIVEGLGYIKNKLLKDWRKTSALPVTIISDSEITIQGLSGVFEPSKNLDLWSAIFYYKTVFDMRPIWVSRNTGESMKVADATAFTLRETMKKITKDFFGGYKLPDENMEAFISEIDP